MYIGQYLPEGADVFSPWFPREADNAWFTFEAIDEGGTSPIFTVEVWHKNTDEPGPGEKNTTATFGTLSGDYKHANFTGLREMVRFKFSLTGSSAWVIFRMLMPSWYDTAPA